jgi:hypothetical protein
MLIAALSGWVALPSDRFYFEGFFAQYLQVG